jgi:hypothetical protein
MEIKKITAFVLLKITKLEVQFKIYLACKLIKVFLDDERVYQNPLNK